MSWQTFLVFVDGKFLQSYQALTKQEVLKHFQGLNLKVEIL